MCFSYEVIKGLQWLGDGRMQPMILGSFDCSMIQHKKMVMAYLNSIKEST